MSSRTTVLAIALQLPRSERAELVKELAASLNDQDETPTADVEAAWLAEVDKRIEKIEQGTAKYETWEVARARVAGRVRPLQP